ncbi:MAG: sortase [Clostridia bacterium]|nr:sortase [Clostridia bacterium]
MASKKKVVNSILTTLIVVLLIAAVILLLIEPIKNYRRNKIVEDTVEEIKEQIIVPDVSEITIVVGKDDVQIEGEDMDFYGTPEEQEQQRKEFEEAYANLPDYVTLNCIGLIEIDSIGQCDPIWDNDTIVDLRYGIGHHQSSCLPGEEGNCTLLGHHMRVEGVFFNKLIDVKIGDLIRITTVDGKEYVYQVDDRQIVDPIYLEDYVDADDGYGKQITLISCTYTDAGTMRIIVIGHLIEGED